MRDYFKRKGRLLIIVCLAVIVGAFTMVAYVGMHYVKAGDNKGKYRIAIENVLIKGDIQKKNGKYYVGRKVEKY